VDRRNGEAIMKAISAIALTLLFAASSMQLMTLSAAAQEVAAAEVKPAKEKAIDCSREVWPHFPPSCLRNADQSTEVRLVAATRR